MKSKIFWGILLIMSAVLLIVNAVFGGIPVVRAVLAVLCLYLVVKELACGDVGGIFFPLAFIYLLARPEIKEYISVKAGSLSAWLVLACAALFAIGFSLLFRKNGISFTYNSGTNRRVGKGYAENNKFSAGSKYIDCRGFEYEKIINRFGAFEIYFTNTEEYVGNGTVCIDNDFGAVEITVPDGWRINCGITSELGAVECEKNDGIPSDAPVISFEGKTKLGSVEISRA